MKYICTDSVSCFDILLNFMQLWQVHLSCTFQLRLYSSLVPLLSKDCPKRQPTLECVGRLINHISTLLHFNPDPLESIHTVFTFNSIWRWAWSDNLPGSKPKVPVSHHITQPLYWLGTSILARRCSSSVL